MQYSLCNCDNSLGYSACKLYMNFTIHARVEDGFSGIHEMRWRWFRVFGWRWQRKWYLAPRASREVVPTARGIPIQFADASRAPLWTAIQTPGASSSAYLRYNLQLLAHSRRPTAGRYYHHACLVEPSFSHLPATIESPTILRMLAPSSLQCHVEITPCRVFFFTLK